MVRAPDPPGTTSQPSGATSSDSALAAAIRKYGRASFTIELLETCADQATVDAAEIAWIDRLRTASPHGYNVRAGGAHGKHTEATRRKLASRVFTPEHRAAISRAMLGRSVTPKQRAVLAEGRRLRPIRPDRKKQPECPPHLGARGRHPSPGYRVLAGRAGPYRGVTQAHIGRIIRGIAWSLNRKQI